MLATVRIDGGPTCIVPHWDYSLAPNSPGLNWDSEDVWDKIMLELFHPSDSTYMLGNKISVPVPRQCRLALPPAWHDAIASLGLLYGAQSYGLGSMRADPKGESAIRVATDRMKTHDGRYVVHPTAIDQCLQLMSVTSTAVSLQCLRCRKIQEVGSRKRYSYPRYLSQATLNKKQNKKEMETSRFN
ncbi:hypothetical protein P168DRAFT_278784 [Aspergillus campestris IBT 28561]|uniref:Polyketide synthase dehydratase domain-containing protein n=1 Tax=Aspergillus campestris (strain IBT 28561) TaxID=1392248 RepID=A0A2I1DHD8_ASPC2|nr:uncharacterized protein P168DRAFT_278784 [Aspergillus campestris IBT 28561]PKY09287.1 hypothetical protein P168DRAFT_278784 [Aspergillus campestris IBT 28561]